MTVHKTFYETISLFFLTNFYIFYQNHKMPVKFPLATAVPVMIWVTYNQIREPGISGLLALGITGKSRPSKFCQIENAHVILITPFTFIYPNEILTTIRNYLAKLFLAI